MTLVFPDSSAINSAPSLKAVSVPGNVSAEHLPSSSSSFSTIMQDTQLAYSVPYDEAADFLMAIREMPAPEDASQSHEGTREKKKWIMKAAKTKPVPGGVRSWARESWSSFVDVLKVSPAPHHLPANDHVKLT